MFKLLNKNIVGSSKNNLWVQTRSVKYDNGNLIAFVLQLQCSDDDTLVDLSALGVEIIASIEQKAKHIEDGESLKTLLNVALDGVAEGVAIECVLAFIKDEMMYVLTKGGGRCFLHRGGKIALITNEPDSTKLIEGKIKVGDVVLCATESFENKIGSEQLKDTLLQADNDIAENFAPMIHLKDEPYGIGAIVVEVKEEEKPIVEPPTMWQATGFSLPKIYLRNEMPRRLNMYIGIGLLCLLIIMIGIGMVRKVKIDEQKAYDNINTLVMAQIAETTSIGDLNPERAKALIRESRNVVEKYLAAKRKVEYVNKAKGLLQEIDRAEQIAFAKNDIELNTLVELSVLSEGLSASKMRHDSKGNLIFVDDVLGRVVSMNMVDRSRQVFENEGDKYIDLSVSESKVYGLKEKNVEDINLKKKDTRSVIEADEFWKNPNRMGTFAGNVYVLDLDQSEIWKYPTLGDEFGSRRRWLAAGITPDLSKVVDMKVVGDIWLLTSSGKLERYSRGAPTKFEVVGLPTTSEENRFVEPSAMWVDEEAVYVLENGASRVVVIGEDGIYKAQYLNAEFKNAQDIVVVDDKVYVLINNVVKEFRIN